MPLDTPDLDIPDPVAHRRQVREAQHGHYQTFNAYLKAAVAQAKTDTVSVKPMPGIPFDIRNDVIRAWQEKGWKIAYHSDQRDGDWINISATSAV